MARINASLVDLSSQGAQIWAFSWSMRKRDRIVARSSGQPDRNHERPQPIFRGVRRARLCHSCRRSACPASRSKPAPGQQSRGPCRSGRTGDSSTHIQRNLHCRRQPVVCQHMPEHAAPGHDVEVDDRPVDEAGVGRCIRRKTEGQGNRPSNGSRRALRCRAPAPSPPGSPGSGRRREIARTGRRARWSPWRCATSKSSRPAPGETRRSRPFRRRRSSSACGGNRRRECAFRRERFALGHAQPKMPGRSSPCSLAQSMAIS